MRKVIGLSPFLMVCLAFLCSCATPYQPYSRFNGGYKDTQLDSNTFRVGFSGNSDTSRETVLNYLLYRCAEVTLENDYDFFVIVDGGSDVKHASMTMPGTYTGHTTHNYATGTSTTHGTYNPGMTLYGQAYSEMAIIKVFHGEAPPNVPDCYSAKELKTYLDPNIKRKKPRSRKNK